MQTMQLFQCWFLGVLFPSKQHIVTTGMVQKRGILLWPDCIVSPMRRECSRKPIQPLLKPSSRFDHVAGGRMANPDRLGELGKDKLESFDATCSLWFRPFATAGRVAL